jgi:RNA polymerase sigma-70 factor (ECF subfamily)
LLRLAKAGDSRALNALFSRQQSALRKWARGRLPNWARSAVDTNDLVQEALVHTFKRIHSFEDRGRGALQSYLREAIRNRIRDELRKVGRQPIRAVLDEAIEDGSLSPFDRTLDSELMQRYKRKLAELTENEQQLVVGRIEMSYTYEQLALATGRETPDAARVALRRAVLKLARKMAE